MPVTPVEIMLSKIWANGLVVVLAALLSLVLVVRLVLQVPVAGSLGLFVVGASLYQFSVAALGILLATFTGSMAQFGLLVIPVLVAMNLLSGSTTPMESMPVWLQDAMQVSPATHFVAFSQAILYRGAGLAVVWPDLAILAAISAVFFGISLLRFRKSILAAA
jgi:ABC-2 type transport system permease protein